MSLSDVDITEIKPGMIVRLKNGDLYLVVSFEFKSGDSLIGINSEGWINIHKKRNNSDYFYVTEIYVPNYASAYTRAFNNLSETIKIGWTLKNKPRMTLNEVKKELGYDFDLILS